MPNANAKQQLTIIMLVNHFTLAHALASNTSECYLFFKFEIIFDGFVVHPDNVKNFVAMVLWYG